jgi:hypothetical protein
VIATALVGGPLLLIAGALLDPPGAGPSEREMIEAYAANLARVDISATLLHAGFVLFALGLLGAAGIVPGRGRRLALTGGLASFVGFAFTSGFTLYDWFAAVLGQELGSERAVEVADGMIGPGLLFGWILPQYLGLLLGPIVLVAGMARGRMVPWWLVALPTLAGLASFVDSGPQLLVLVPFSLLAVLGVALARVVTQRG